MGRVVCSPYPLKKALYVAALGAAFLPLINEAPAKVHQAKDLVAFARRARRLALGLLTTPRPTYTCGSPTAGTTLHRHTGAGHAALA